jgi:molybdate transport system substrate-binding protein
MQTSLRGLVLATLGLGAALCASAGSLAAAEIKVLTAGAIRGVLEALLPEFEQASGHKVVLDNATAGVLAKRIAGGEAFDLAVITPGVIDEAARGGKIAGARVDLAKVGMGVAVKEGAAAPDISTVEAFKQALLAAKTVAYIDPKAGGSSGIYFDGLIDRLGIGAEVRAKARLKAGGHVADLVASGEAELAVHQISEILPVKGVRLVGPLPAPVQNTTVYSAGLGTGAKDPAAAKALLDHFAGPAAAAVLSAKGMEKP